METQFGYKNLINYDDINIYVKFIYAMSGVNPSAKAFLYRIVTDRDIDAAQIILKINNGADNIIENKDIKAGIATEREVVI